MLERLRILGSDAALHDRYVVVDAPASGSALELLSVAAGVKRIAPAGALNRIAESVESFLSDATRFGALVTAAPEELAVRKAIETAAAMREQAGVFNVAALMNRVPDALFNTSELATMAPLRGHAELAVRRHASRENALIGARRLAAAGLETIILPAMFTPTLGHPELSEIGDVLEAELLD